jgi:RsiW-degrading membrane proteinase PrsW (M82 family)
MQWRKLTRVTGSTEEALQYAVDRNWLTVAGHSACLTVEGRQLITKGFN